MKYLNYLLFSTGFLAVSCSNAFAVTASPSLEDAWKTPPQEAKVRAYWWWLNGNVTKEAITTDLEAMKKMGFGGAVLFDADGSSQGGNQEVPAGPTFGSPEWRELYKHTLREASRLGLTISLNIQSGWNLGGPSVQAQDAAKITVWKETAIHGPSDFQGKLAEPDHTNPFYRDVAVLAWKNHQPTEKPASGIHDLRDKTLLSHLPGSAPDLRRLLNESPTEASDRPISSNEVLNLTEKLRADGSLDWKVPAGDWKVLRFGYTVSPSARVSTSSGAWKGYALDVFDEIAFRKYWQAVVAPLIEDAGPLAGKSLKYLHTDSWEIEPINWTDRLPSEFKKRRGYDIERWFPVIAGHLVESRDASNRFLADFRQTLGDLAIDQHYKPFKDLAHAAGLEIHPESGGPHVVPIDAQRCLGMDDAPMSEFWATSWKHRVGDANRFFVKQPASAAHTYGHPLVMAEGFTTIGPHWQERLWNNLKPTFDKALTEGLNSLVWHAWVCSPKETGIPGQQYFAGTHLNPKVTWWSRSKPFFDYINRSQALLQRGVPVSDVLYYYGDQIPNYTQLRDADPAGVGHNFDYDVITADALINRISVKDGRLVLPEGTSYRLLVLADLPWMPISVLEKIRELKSAGATIIGPRPESPEGLLDSIQKKAAFDKTTESLWGGNHPIIATKSATDALKTLNVKPDFSFTGGSAKAEIRYIHRQDSDAEIYFISSRGETPETVTASFRVTGKAPELWDAVTGERRIAPAFTMADGLTQVPLSFDPCGSSFVIFRAPGKPADIIPIPQTRSELTGTWSLSFDPQWGGPAKTIFPELSDWSTNKDPGIQHYSGTATYHKTFDLADPSGRTWLDLGDVRELAEIRLNGKSLGIVWTPPFRVEITEAVRAKGNQLEIDVVNFWPNRIIGDAAFPLKERFTQTNIQELKATTALIPSGLLGPVRILGRPNP